MKIFVHGQPSMNGSASRNHDAIRYVNASGSYGVCSSSGMSVRTHCCAMSEMAKMKSAILNWTIVGGVGSSTRLMSIVGLKTSGLGWTRQISLVAARYACSRITCVPHMVKHRAICVCRHTSCSALCVCGMTCAVLKRSTYCHTHTKSLPTPSATGSAEISSTPSCRPMERPVSTRRGTPERFTMSTVEKTTRIRGWSFRLSAGLKRQRICRLPCAQRVRCRYAARIVSGARPEVKVRG
mmetsp:Transcript_6511/g.20496  ORF Transcript_6511/g.20496 Transcript_6511/m.20496 type:complete len:239 (+) Transcript_6511:324-1040(+)